MEGILKNIFFATITSLLTIIPAILFAGWLEKIGAIRHNKNSRMAMALVSLFFIFIKPVLFNTVSWWLWGIGIFLGATLAFNRGDLSKTLAQGRWWWKSETKKTKH